MTPSMKKSLRWSIYKRLIFHKQDERYESRSFYLKSFEMRFITLKNVERRGDASRSYLKLNLFLIVVEDH